jgi:hypothetical protein
MEKVAKTYLMISGTLMPAMAGITLLNIVRKHNIIDNKTIMIFAGLSILSAYATARMLNK